MKKQILICLFFVCGGLAFADEIADEPVKTFKGHTRDVLSVAFSPDGKYIASGSDDMTIKLWSIDGNLIRTLKGHTDSVYSVAFSPDGKYIASGSNDMTIKFWSIYGILISNLGKHTSTVYSVAFFPDGKYIASGSGDGTIKLWSIDGSLIKTLEGHTYPTYAVLSVAFSPDGKYIASGSGDGTIKLWSIDGSLIKTLEGHTYHTYTVLSVAFSPDGKYLAVSYGNKIKRCPIITIFENLYYVTENTELKSSTGKVLTKLPVGTKLKLEKTEGNFCYVKLSDTLKGWVDSKDLSAEKPDLLKPVIRIISKSFDDPTLYVKGVVYDDKEVRSVRFGDLELSRADFEVERGNYEDAYPFEAKITITPGMKLVLNAEDTSGKTTEVPINIEETIPDYTPKYAKLEVKSKSSVMKKPDINSEKLTDVNEKTVLVAVGYKGDWYYLEGGGWIDKNAVKEKEEISEELQEAVSLKVEKEEKGPKIVESPVDVDVDIPSGKPNPDAVGVIIAVKNYEHKDVPEVEYAFNDAETMKDYFTKVFGINKDNIIFIKDAKKSDFERLFGTKDDYKGQVYNYVKPGKSDLFIYYVGHGAPDVNTKEAYFLPSDAHPNYVRLNGYPMDVFYKNLSSIPAKSITVIADACFSGQAQTGMLISRASGIAVVPKVKFSGTLFTASSGEQVASWYPEMRHSLFTYFFLKGLKGEADSNQDKNITTDELNEYVRQNVSYQARRLYNREQTPEFSGENKIFVSFK